MGWSFDIPGVGTVKTDSPDETAKSVVSTVSNTVNRNLDDASRGDIGKAISTQVTAVANLLTLPVKTVYYAARGDNKGVSDTFQRAAGSLTNIAGGLSVNLAQNNQSFYRDKTLNDLTFGYAQDFAGFARGARTLQNDAYLSTEDRNSAIRYGVKTAAIGGTVRAVQSYFGGSETATATTEAIKAPKVASDAWGAKEYLLYGSASAGIAKSLLSGDVKSAAAGISNLTGLPDVSGYLPDKQPEVPSYLAPTTKQPSYLGTQVNDPWDFSGSADSGISAQTSIMPYLLIGGLLIGSLLIFRGRK